VPGIGCFDKRKGGSSPEIACMKRCQDSRASRHRMQLESFASQVSAKATKYAGERRFCRCGQ
jgi:hypothetical protein